MNIREMVTLACARVSLAFDATISTIDAALDALNARQLLSEATGPRGALDLCVASMAMQLAYDGGFYNHRGVTPVRILGSDALCSAWLRGKADAKMAEQAKRNRPVVESW